MTGSKAKNLKIKASSNLSKPKNSLLARGKLRNKHRKVVFWKSPLSLGARKFWSRHLLRKRSCDEFKRRKQREWSTNHQMMFWGVLSLISVRVLKF